MNSGINLLKSENKYKLIVVDFLELKMLVVEFKFKYFVVLKLYLFELIFVFCDLYINILL